LLSSIAPSSKLPAGDAYACLGLSRLKQERSAQDTVLVKALMNDLGWYYRDNGTRPYFAKRKPDCLLILK